MANTAASTSARRFMTPREVADLIPGMTTEKLSQLRFTGKGPRFYKPTPRTVVYDEAQVLDWLDSTSRQISGAS